jgi:hypothetical protein
MECSQRRTESVKVAIKAQTKLLHMVLLVKLWLISCLRIDQVVNFGSCFPGPGRYPI